MYVHVSIVLVCMCANMGVVQEASRHADELLKAEEKEKQQAEKKKQRNKKVL